MACDDQDSRADLDAILDHGRRRVHRLRTGPHGGRRARPRGAQRRQAHLCRQPGPRSTRSPRTRATACSRPTSATGRRWRRRFAAFAPEAVIHLAAESHVDRSIDGPGAFVATNVVGTCVLLEAARAYWRELPAASARRVPLPPRLHRRGLRLARRRGAVHRDLALRPELALFGEQGRLRPSRPRLAPDLRPAGDRDQLLEQLRAVPVSREADPADDPQGAGGQSRCRSTARRERPRLDPRRGPCARPAGGAGARARRARPTPSAARSERRNLDVVHAICALLDGLGRRRTARRASA